MVFFETGDSKKGASKGPAPSDETIASLYSSDASRSVKPAKSDNAELSFLFTPAEKLGNYTNQAEQTSSLIKNLSPREMATALSTISHRFTEPATWANAREYEMTVSAIDKRVDAFLQEFSRVHGRPATMEELRDPIQFKKLTQGHAELEARWQEFQTQALPAVPKKAAHDTSIRSLQEQAQRSMDDICDKSHLPPVKFKFTRDDTTRDSRSERQAFYRSGTITMPEQTLARETATRSSIVDTFAHELKHHEQVVLATAKSIEDIAGDKPLDERQIKAIQSKYKNEFEIELTEKFILDVQQWKAGHKLTNEERARADSYQRSFAQDKAIGKKEDQIALLADIDKVAKERSGWEAMKLLDASAKNLPSLEKKVVDGLLEQYRKIKSGEAAADTWTDKVDELAKSKLTIVAQIWIRSLQEAVLRDRRNSLVHSEAERAGKDAAEALKSGFRPNSRFEGLKGARDGGES